MVSCQKGPTRHAYAWQIEPFWWVTLEMSYATWGGLNIQIQYIPRNMHTVFALLCFVVVIHWLIFPYPSGSLHWHSNDCPSASKATLMNMDKYFMWIHYERLHNHNKAKHNKTVCIFLGIYCTVLPLYEFPLWRSRHRLIYNRRFPLLVGYFLFTRTLAVSFCGYYPSTLAYSQVPLHIPRLGTRRLMYVQDIYNLQYLDWQVLSHRRSRACRWLGARYCINQAA